MSTPSHAGQAIVDSLKLHGVERVFSVPGESYLAVLDGLHASGIENVVCRQEGGAAYMAEATGKATGRPGVAMVTRGPGAANAFVAVHVAWQDGTPMVLFVGLVPTADRMRESFQEFDPHAWFGTQAKRVFVLDEPERASEVVAEAFFAAASGRPGPVIVGLPEDVIAKEFIGDLVSPLPVAEGAVSAAQLAGLKARLEKAERPLLMVGGQRWTPEAAQQVTAFAERHRLPVVQDWHASDRVPFSSSVNMGCLGYGRNDAAAYMLDDADLLVCVGAVPSDVPTDGFTLRQGSDAVNVLVSIDTALLGRSGPVAEHIIASPVAFASAVGELELAGAASLKQRWDAWRAAGRAAQERSATIPAVDQLPATAEGTAHMSVLMGQLLAGLPSTLMHTVGAGNHTAWAQMYAPTEVFPSQLATRNGSMGYSIPAAIAAAKAFPDRPVLAVCGDGEFLMNGQELATAVQYGTPLLVVVMANGQYGTIRAHQEGHYPDRVSGTQLENPNFAAFAEAFGAHGEFVENNEQIPGAVQRALNAVLTQRRSALIHIVTDQAIDLPTPLPAHEPVATSSSLASSPSSAALETAGAK